jgi:hypothetical protein
MGRDVIVVTLGEKEEISEVDFTELGWDMQRTMEWLHNMAYVYLRNKHKQYKWGD